MSKQIVEHSLIYETKPYSAGRYKWGEVLMILAKDTICLEDEDLLLIGTMDPEEGEQYGDHLVELIRSRPETDKEYEKRLASEERQKVWSKQRRYETYLALKKEFEPDSDNNT